MVLCIGTGVVMPSGADGVRLSIRDFGAKGDGVAKDTAAFQAAFAEVVKRGGGELVLPAGTYLTGSLVLPSHLTLRLGKDAVIQGSDDPADYPLIEARWEGMMKPARRGLIAADHAQDITLAGEGAIRGGATVGKSRSPRGAVLIEPVECSGFHIQGLTLENHSVWTFHPSFCRDVSVSHVIFHTDGANADGIDPDSVAGMRIEDCEFQTGDDCIAIKSGKGQEGARINRPTTDVLIRNCVFTSGHAGVAIGSEVSGGIRNVLIQHCRADHPSRLLRIKTCAGRGAVIENIAAEDVESAVTLLTLETDYHSNPDSQGIPGDEGITRIRNIRVSRAKATGSGKSFVEVTGFPEHPVEGLQLQDLQGEAEQGIILRHVRDARVGGIHLQLRKKGPLLATLDVTGSGLEAAVPAKEAKSKTPKAK